MNISPPHAEYLSYIWTQILSESEGGWSEQEFAEQKGINDLVIEVFSLHLPPDLTVERLRTEPAVLLPAAEAFLFKLVRRAEVTVGKTDEELYEAIDRLQVAEMADELYPMALEALDLLPRIAMAETVIKGDQYDWDGDLARMAG